MTRRAAKAGIDLKAAVEIEWAVGRGDAPDGQFVAACTGPAYGMTRLVELSDYAADVLAALDEQDVPVDQIHPEYSAGQYELSVGAADPVAAADRSVLVRQTIRAVSQRHGMRASFAPSVVPGTVGNGGHVHISAWRDGANLFAGGDGRYGMTPRRRPSPPASWTPFPRCARSGRPARPATCGWSRRTGPARSPAGAGRPGRPGCASSPGWSAARHRPRTSR
jgi:glutamine synthetase